MHKLTAFGMPDPVTVTLSVTSLCAACVVKVYSFFQELEAAGDEFEDIARYVRLAHNNLNRLRTILEESPTFPAETAEQYEKDLRWLQIEIQNIHAQMRPALEAIMSPSSSIFSRVKQRHRLARGELARLESRLQTFNHQISLLLNLRTFAAVDELVKPIMETRSAVSRIETTVNITLEEQRKLVSDKQKVGVSALQLSAWELIHMAEGPPPPKYDGEADDCPQHPMDKGLRPSLSSPSSSSYSYSQSTFSQGSSASTPLTAQSPATPYDAPSFVTQTDELASNIFAHKSPYPNPAGLGSPQKWDSEKWAFGGKGT